MLATARTFALLGVEAREIRVEVDVRQGLPAFTLVGLPDAAVRESRERVRAALANSGFEFPQKRITANLAPADLRKAGPGFDLAIAAAVLVATEQLPAAALADVALAGELALDGSIRPVPGTLAMAESAARAGMRALVVPAACAAGAALIAPGRVIPVDRLERLCKLGGADEPACPDPATASTNGAVSLPDLADLRGQPGLRRALEVAAAGGHSLMIGGPPGAGKSMAARRLPSILPPLDRGELVEAARVASACGRPLEPVIGGRRPFRAPHHTISTAGLIGGGNPPRPGEVTLAHRGVLFLDELPEFGRGTLEALRQPLEDGSVRIVRARYSLELPCRFQLVAAANPCPCGRGPGSGQCTCDSVALRSYGAKLTAALADRIDISIVVEQPDPRSFTEPGESSGAVRDRVVAARERRSARPAIEIGAAIEGLLAEAGIAGVLSGRGRERTIRLARTIADLDGVDSIAVEHAEEALALRRRGKR
ncbi:MAG: magnesium chelatase family protein [Solirubrobacterales bacterium]|nr:magnesium chelatase family protein [Solirubrobacterales bacterium]